MSAARECYIVLPGIGEKFRNGGLMVAVEIAQLLSAKIAVTHEEPAAGTISFNKALRYGSGAVFITTWGPLAAKHIKIIRRNAPAARIIHYAQSFGWGIKIPRDIPVICVSRYVMSQWALNGEDRRLAYIPPPLNPCFSFGEGERDIDILAHERKQNDYALKKLIPALKNSNYRLEILRGWMPQENFAQKLKRARIFLYLTGTHRAGFFRKLPAEGFGMPALEAAVCGPLVGSNLLGGVTDFLSPGENCIKLQTGDLDFDLRQIRAALDNFSIDCVKTTHTKADELQKLYSRQTVKEHWLNFLASDKIKAI